MGQFLLLQLLLLRFLYITIHIHECSCDAMKKLTAAWKTDLGGSRIEELL
jgi:hypothetical protein